MGITRSNNGITIKPRSDDQILQVAGLQGETGPAVIFVDYSTAFGLYGHQPATHSLVHFLGQGTAPRQQTCPQIKLQMTKMSVESVNHILGWVPGLYMIISLGKFYFQYIIRTSWRQMCPALSYSRHISQSPIFGGG